MNENNNVATVEEKKKKGMSTGAVIGIGVLAAVAGFVAGKMTRKTKTASSEFDDFCDEDWDVVDEDEEVNPE